MFIKISPSRLSLSFESLGGKETSGCKRCFWLRENLDDKGKPIWKRPKSIFPGLPIAVDLKLKDYYDNESIFIVNTIFKEDFQYLNYGKIQYS